MVEPLTLLAFVPAALALNLTPGADMMFCLAQGVRNGARAAWAASAGIALGGLIHVFIAGAGLSALLTAWPVAFDIIRWVGVAYLVWLALQALRAHPGAEPSALPGSGHAFRGGLLINLANPKVILFVLAFVPQFVTPEAGSVLAQFMVFGGVMAVGGFIINGIVGASADALAQRFKQRSRWLDVVTAGIFSALAARLAILEIS
ncbi:LysE family translocator [Roseobacter denitrificans]|uniref:LysE family protein n=1 Tax=Roseobacter denitrificans (strain ATCC 33942 / OCh 114) TaxID=375451 RepID=Q163C7_ROSDO|nr:LysE family translocator [Roseobacter denitrificans]ABG32916.1 LysE family protein [Roseobacter denitrificans OCh 114]AVL52307.1 LysE family translocator [Roseobacter denitrificans]SFG45840.1 Threonine/homoserine/homoserine lactone efflux protein [Roseobacter denitrificans OCh 114]